MENFLKRCAAYSQRSRSLEVPNAIASQVFHYARFEFEKPITHFESALVIFSVDIDVGNKKLGLINKGRNDIFVHKFYNEYHVGEIEEQTIPLLLDLFNSRGIPVTFAIRGQLTEVDNTLLPLLLDSPVKHDIGGHGYTHKNFSILSRKEAENELELLSVGLKNYGITAKSFVFPRNVVSHVDLLEKFGYECYRGAGNFLNDGMYIKRIGRIYDVHPSVYLDQNMYVSMLRTFLEIAIRKRTPLHFWFHPWNFGETAKQARKNIDAILTPLVDYAKAREECQMLQFKTMFSAAKKADSKLNTE
jgi:peptidoglycan/xylan/chitin deacetylase (PgdA/CDA1 family)